MISILCSAGIIFGILDVSTAGIQHNSTAKPNMIFMLMDDVSLSQLSSFIIFYLNHLFFSDGLG